MKKLLALILSLCLLPLVSAQAFYDLSYSHFAYSSVENLVYRGIVEDKTYFYPNTPVTRAEFLAVLMKSMNAEAEGSSLVSAHLSKGHWYADYPDVAVGEWYAPAVSWAAAHSYTSAKSDGNLYPLEALTRAEAAKLIVEVFLGGEIIGGFDPNFTDLDSSAWYYPYILSVYNAGVMNGYTDASGNSLGLFRPAGLITRAEMATIIERALYLNPETSFGDEDDYLSYTAVATSSAQIKVQYLTAVSASAVKLSSYKLLDSAGKSVMLSSIIQDDPRTVLLTTAAQAPGATYILTVSNVTSLKTERPLSSATQTVSFFGYTTDTALLSIALDPSFSPDSYLPVNASGVELLRLRLTASGSGGATLSSLKLTHKGINLGTELTNIKLYADGELIGEKKGFSSSDRTASINLKPTLAIAAGSTVTLSVCANFTGASDAQTTHYLSLPSQDAITLSGATLTGTFPLNGPQFRRSSVTTGTLVYTVQELDEEIELGETSTLAKIALQAQDEDIKISSVSFVLSGIDEEYLENLKLKIGSRTVGTLSSLSDNEFTFNFSDSPYTLEANTRKTMLLTGELTSGSGSSVKLTLDEISNTGLTYGYGTGTSESETSAEDQDVPVTGFVLTIDEAPDNPNGYTLWAGESRQTIAKFEFAAEGSDLTLENLSFTLTTQNFADFDFEDLTVYWGGTSVGDFLPDGNGTETFQIEEPLVLEAGHTKNLTIKAKIAEALTDTVGTFQVSFSPLSSSALNFSVEKANGDSLLRSEVSPSGDLSLKGGSFRVKSDEN